MIRIHNRVNEYEKNMRILCTYTNYTLYLPALFAHFQTSMSVPRVQTIATKNTEYVLTTRHCSHVPAKRGTQETELTVSVRYGVECETTYKTIVSLWHAF